MRRILAILLIVPELAWAQDGTNAPVVPPMSIQEFGSACAYPDAALRARAQGGTELTYTVTADGEIVDVAVLYRSGSDDLDKAAVQCVGHWRINPANADAATTVGPHRGAIVWKLLSATPEATSATSLGQFKSEPAVCDRYYPPIALRLHIEGETVLQFRITTEGNVRGASVLQSSGDIDLDDAAVACVKFWHYKPAMKDGRPTEVTWKARVKWQIK